MAKIPFSIDYRPQIESGEYKVETKDGRPVEIVKWDLRSPHGNAPILAIVHGDYDCNRTYSDKGYSTIDSDRLFIVTPKPELSEFEDKLRIICENAVKEAYLSPCCTSEDFAKNHAAELLDLARKEPCEQIVDHIKKAYENGKAEVLKDLPMWKKRDDFDYPTHFCGVVISGGQTTTLPVVIADGYEIPISELLNKLPKEE